MLEHQNASISHCLTKLSKEQYSTVSSSTERDTKSTKELKTIVIGQNTKYQRNIVTRLEKYVTRLRTVL